MLWIFIEKIKQSLTNLSNYFTHPQVVSLLEYETSLQLITFPPPALYGVLQDVFHAVTVGRSHVHILRPDFFHVVLLLLV